MTAYVGRRIAQAVFVVWAAFTVTFFALRLLPGDPVALMLSNRSTGGAPTPQEIATIRADLGFDRPAVVQYFSALGDLLHGDLGRSIQSGRTVSSTIAVSLPKTMDLGMVALVLSLVGGLALAVAANLGPSALRRQVLRSVPSMIISLPSFWVGLLLIQLFALHWRIFPSLNATGVSGVILPAVTLALPGIALIAQVLGKSLHSTLQEPYVDTIRAAGAGPLRVLVGHGLRNAAIPAVTVIGLLVGNLIGGAVVVETVFSRPGMGRDIGFAVTNQDLPVVQGVVIVASLAFVTVNLAVDLLYPVLDPRMRSTSRSVAAR
ncbi:ABC transporter permease [Rhodococcoides yunnanense]|uniref:ABC transporter permease n=1 Tax=Rhodococcoides yunnanense TaxID=278209 RepID=UPI000933788E|nr:ABC transporter permease [Rhodococcus yunnanensis]